MTDQELDQMMRRALLDAAAQEAEALAELEAAGTADQVDAQLRAAYTEGVEQNG